MAAFDFRGMSLVRPINRMANGVVAFCQNVRSYILGGFTSRNPLSAAIVSALPTPIHTIKRLNDSTPNGPASGYSLIIAASTSLYVWNSTIGLVKVADGLSGNPVSMIPFRPNTSVQPWMYVCDSAPMGAVTLHTKYLISGDPVDFVSNGMMKVRSDGLIYKMGIEEPQLAPLVSTTNSEVTTTGTLLATAIPWTNYSGANSSYDYGETNGYPKPSPDGTAPYVVNCLNASFITINSITGTANVNGNATATPTTSGPVTNTYPAYFIMAAGTGVTPPASATIITGAFTDGAGNVIAAGVAPLHVPSVVDVGAVIGVSNAIQVPYGAVDFQIGIDSAGNSFHSNSGSFAISTTVTTNALPTVTAILSTLTAYYWGDSPTSGPVGSYIWKNPDDPGGSGPTRSTSDAVGTTTGNSFIFDATFSGGIPQLPGIGNATVPMLWTTLSPESVAIGSNAVFAAPITVTYPTNTQFANFNFCLTGSIYFPAPGNYTFVLTSHDDVIWGIGGGVTLVSATESGSGEGGGTSLSNYGQTITVVGGYPLLPRETYTSGNDDDYAETTVVVSVANAGIYPIELDFDYWYRAERILLLMCSATAGGGATIIPPLPIGVRENTQYRYTYRSSATGAVSNPSPESAVESVPVIANTVTSFWSPDPQVDVVDDYRIDSATADFTYVNTGPNDDTGPVTNTPVTDSLSDIDLGTQLLDYSNFEPFPSIDLPQKGICSVSGGVITWVSGGAIGGTATGFNIRWLPGTTILIGSPTSLPYVFIARPTSNSSVTIPGVPDGTNLAYQIEEPTLAAQPIPYVSGPTDNVPFALGVGDPLRQGTMYWCAGSNLDAAPDTNQQDLTDPSESLVNLILTGGRGIVHTIKRAIAVMPNFFNALATVTGVEGSTWSTQTTGIDRGLFIPRCLCVDGSGLMFFRVDDGIHVSQDGLSSQSITDEDLYPLFSHEGSTPQSVTRNGNTIYPPNDALPQLQKFSIQNAYVYWDYQDLNGTDRTLVFDIAAKGWIWDSYQWPVTVHAPNEGQSVQGTLVGCTDGSIRQFTSTGAETGTTFTVLTGAIGGVGWCHLRELTLEYVSTMPVTLTAIPADTGNGSYGPSLMTLPSTNGTLTKLKLSDAPTPNKWKLLWFQFSSTSPFTVNLEGFAVKIKPWGETGPYREVRPFSGEQEGGI